MCAGKKCGEYDAKGLLGRRVAREKGGMGGMVPQHIIIRMDYIFGTPLPP